MNITQENVDSLNAVVKIKITPDDYQTKVENQIKKYQKDARIPGFRPGKVPAGMIKKMYGKSILADELNRLLNDSIHKYLTENNIEILGNPLPQSENNEKADWENPSEFEFLYDLGLAPKINVDLKLAGAFKYYDVQVDAEMLEKYVADIRRKYGKFSNPEAAAEGDILYGDLQELNADGTEKEEGIKTTTTVAIEFVKDAKEKAKLVGVKKDEVVVFNPAKAVDNQSELAAMLGVDKEVVGAVKADFKLTIKTVNRIEKAEMNQELFDKIYGADAVATEAEFMAKVKEDIAQMFTADSDRKLQNDMVEQLIKSLNIVLPDNFLKRWLMAANEKPITQEQVDAEYDEYAKGLKWRLIENQIIKNNSIQVNAEEVKEFAKSMIRNQFAQYGQANMDDAMLDNLAKNYMEKEEQVRKMYENIAAQKVFEYFKGAVALNKQQVSYDEFVKLVSNN
jgi:trigger factor